MITKESLAEFVSLYLGEYHPGCLAVNSSLSITERVFSSRPIPIHLAKQILNLTENKHTCFIEFPHPVESPELQYPVLWDFKAWIYAVERRDRVRRYYKNLQIESELYICNTKIIARHVMTVLTAFSQEQCESIAHTILKSKNFQALVVFGCSEDKLMTKEDLLEE